MSSSRRHLLHEYDPPAWAASLKNKPKYFVKLAQRNTPIAEWNLQDVPNGFQIWIKRDDMTGSTLSGSKVRKLEFIFADAIDQNCDEVMTMGSPWSNHCRSTSIVARQLGLKCYLFIYDHLDENKSNNISCRGNTLLMKLMNSDVIRTEFCGLDNIYKKMEEFAKQLRTESNSSAYVIPVGGSSYVGLFGYITCFQELVEQNVLEDHTDLFVTSGSTGTAAALAIGNYLTGSKLKIHAVSVSRNKEKVFSCIQQEIDMTGLENVRAEDIIDVMMGYRDEGYGKSTKEEMEDIVRIAHKTGIILDPVYTVKTVRRMLVEMKNNPNRFKGKKVLFLHTGGLFNVFNGSVTSYLNE